jgi:hypothetical protein
MTIANEGKKDRDARLLERRAGVWGTHHSMLVELIRDLYRSSRSGDAIGHYSTYAGIPLLVSVLQSFKKLRHAVAGFPNLELREFDLTIK